MTIQYRPATNEEIRSHAAETGRVRIRIEFTDRHIRRRIKFVDGVPYAQRNGIPWQVAGTVMVKTSGKEIMDELTVL